MPTPNAYQLRKARHIAAFIESAYSVSTLNRRQLAQCVAIMSPEEWRRVSFAAGEPSADIEAKTAVLAILRGRELRIVRRIG